MKLFLLFIFYLLLQIDSLGQSIGSTIHSTTTFTTKDGLPSNFIYDLSQDQFGYLWIATDNGVSCFDGKRFKNYTTKNGLPSNDVLQVILDGTGTVWVNCYKQPPSYFDIQTNRFICIENNKLVTEICSDFISNIQQTRDGILFENKKGRIIYTKQVLGTVVLNNGNKKALSSIVVRDKIYLLSSDGTHDYNVFINSKKIGEFGCSTDQNEYRAIYYKGVIYKISKTGIIQIKPCFYPKVSAVEKTIKLPNETIKRLCLSGKHCLVIANSGKIFHYKLSSLELIQVIENDKKANAALIDNNGNSWIGTINEGLVYRSNSNLTHIDHNSSMHLNIQQMAIAKDGGFVFGNIASQIEKQLQNKSVVINTNNAEKTDSWCRGIHLFGNKLFAVFDNGIFDIDAPVKIRVLRNSLPPSFKTSEKLNDSILLLGNFQGLYKFNINNRKVELLGHSKERILKIKRVDDEHFYFIAEKGVYLFNWKTKHEILAYTHSRFKNDKIIDIALNSKNQIWFSSNKGNLYLFEGQKQLLQLIKNTNLPVNIVSILAIDEQLWIGSKTGIYILDYSNHNQLNYKTIGIQDGLNSNFINTLFYANKKVYACTSEGVSIIPEGFSQPIYTILPRIVSVRIEGETKPIQKKYFLTSQENNIVLELTGVDITGHLKNLCYSINGGEFLNLEGNYLTLKLEGGKNTIQIRTLDKNNIQHAELLTVEFNIAIPVHKRTWFWMLISVLVTALIVYILNRRNINKQKKLLATEVLLQNQRRAITADLHDDIGATLSSLQLNSAVANKVIDFDLEKSKKLLSTIELQSQQMAEKISDFVWSIKSDEEQFMPLSLRIRNFASEILSPTEINYSLNFDPTIDDIKDFYLRKNILLIVKEGINNAVKYSNARILKVEIRQNDEHQISIIIEDNGVGFDPLVTLGNGINNMKSRTTELKGELNIHSIKNEGTRISITLPYR